MSSPLVTYEDQFLNVYTRGEVLGKPGGQGEVFRTKDDPNIAIKILKHESQPITDQETINEYIKHLERIRLLPIPERCKVSVPVAILRRTAGYVMQLLDGMIPFDCFIASSTEKIQLEKLTFPLWLSRCNKEVAVRIMHYYRTGGLRRRLEVFSKFSATLSRFHGRGLMYGDISPNNIYVSGDTASSEVWFIDSDNIVFETAEGGRAFYTPRFGAPEIVQGKGRSRPATDCYSFVVMLFWFIANNHPFEGALLKEGDWAEESTEETNMEAAYAGKLPWINDSGDRSNSSDEMQLPSCLIFTDEIQSLLRNTFERGRLCWEERPVIYHWPVALAKASDITVQCPACSMSWYYYIDGDQCPYCKESKPEILHFEAYKWSGRRIPIGKPCWTFVREIGKSKINVPRRLMEPFSMTENDQPLMECIVSDADILLKVTSQCSFPVKIAVSGINDGKFKEVTSQMRIPLNDRISVLWIYCDGDEPRLIRCTKLRGKK